MTDQTAYWVGLSKAPGIGPARMRRLLDYFGSAQEAWGAACSDLVQAGLDARTSEAVAPSRRETDLHAEMERLEKAGVRALTLESEGYPKRLLETSDAPPVLYVLGELEWYGRAID
jgi:DNA processing protein